MTPRKITPENLFNNIVETLADNVPHQKSFSYFEEDRSNPANSQFNKRFGRQKSVHHILGGAKSADVLLWRNKRISASVLSGATAIWGLFEWFNYNFLTLVSFALILGLIAQFVCSNGSGLLNRSASKVPRLVLPDELFVNIATSVGYEINRCLGFLQDVSCRGNLKQLLMVVTSLWAAAVIGSWCNFLTVLYIGFVAAHTLPVLYESYEDQVDSFIYNAIEQLQNHYQKLDTGVLRKITKGHYGSKYE